MIVFLPALPSVPGAWMLKQAGLNHLSTLPKYGSQPAIALGRGVPVLVV